MAVSAVADRPRLLFVDDEEPVLEAAHEYFEAQGYDVDCARELEEAQALVSFVRYAALVADLRLTGSHGTEGFEVLRFVRERSPDTHVLMLTAYGSAPVEAEARRLGVDAFLQKPQPLAEVAGILGGMVGGRK
jgi:DNA-binding response OmpR family regulator